MEEQYTYIAALELQRWDGGAVEEFEVSETCVNEGEE